jgi:hypothetical protein
MIMEITYREIIGTLTSKNLENYVPDGIYYSKPVIGLYLNKIVDCFFLYYYDFDTKIIYQPYARIAVDSENKTAAYYYHFKEKPFSAILPESFVSAIPYDEAYKSAESSFEFCYGQIRGFAFKSELSQEQKNLLVEYWRAFDATIDRELKPFYIELSPEFWKWLKELKELKELEETYFNGGR